MDNSLLKRFGIAAQWLIGLAMLYWLGRTLADQWEDIRSVSISIMPGYLGGALSTLILFYLLYVVSWIRILTWLRGEQEDWPKPIQARIFFLSILTRYLPAGKVVNVGSRIELFHRQGGRRATAFAAVLIEQVFFMGGAVMLLWMVLAFVPGISLPPQVASVRAWLIFGGVFILAALLWFDKLLQALVRRMRLSQFAGVKFQMGWGQKIELLLRFLAINLSQGLAAFLFFKAVSPLPGSDLSFILYVGAAYPLSRLIGQVVAFIPGGLGVREGIYAMLLQAYAPVGVLLVVGALMRLASMLLELGIVSGLVLATRMRVRSA